MGMELVDVDDVDEVDGGERIVFPDHTVFTKNLISEFVSRSRKEGTATACCLKKGYATLRSVTSTMSVLDNGDNYQYELFYYPEGKSVDGSRPLVIDPDEDAAFVRFPEHVVPGKDYVAPLTTKRIFHIEHWSNLWAANISGVLGRIREFKSSPKLKLLAMALRARSSNPWKVSSKNVIIGKNCDIHPRAYLENAVIGDNVEVGAGAVIRGAEIGNNVVISNNAIVFMSVVGDDCALISGCCMQFTLAFPGVVQANRFLNDVTMGRNSFVGDGVTLTDFRFDGQNMKVMHKGRLVDTGGVFLGSCVGHNSYLGSGVIVGPGREIPNDVKVVVNRSRMIMNGDLNGDFQIIKKDQGN